MVRLHTIGEKEIVLYRKRLIPEETICLKDDHIEMVDKEKNYLITSWKALKPRGDFATGCSIYYLSDGIKISKFFTSTGELLYYYCDILKSDMDLHNNLTCVDLLVDVKVFPSGKVQVLDIEELPMAHELGLLSIDDMKLSLQRLAHLLAMIENNQFGHAVKVLEAYSNKVILR